MTYWAFQLAVTVLDCYQLRIAKCIDEGTVSDYPSIIESLNPKTTVDLNTVSSRSNLMQESKMPKARPDIYSTVTDLAKFLGKSTLRPSPTASQ